MSKKADIKALYKGLDSVLEFLYNNQTGFGWEHRDIHDKLKLGNEDPTHVYLLCDKLKKDGFVNLDLSYQSYVEKKGDSNITFKVQDPNAEMFFINYHGFEFYLKGGYRSKHQESIKKNNWLTIKIIAAVLNAMLIIGIGLYGLVMTTEKKKLENKIEKLEKRVDQLSSTLV